MTEFLLRVKDCFSISDRGAVLTGTITSGSVRIGQRVTISSPLHATQAVVAGVEAMGRVLDFARAGDTVGILVKPYDPKALPDGITVQGEHAEVNLTVTSAGRPWWKLW